MVAFGPFGSFAVVAEVVAAAVVVAVARLDYIAVVLVAVAVAVVVDAAVVASFVGLVVADFADEIDSPSLDYLGCSGLD